MIRRPPISTRTDTPVPYTPLFRSKLRGRDQVDAVRWRGDRQCFGLSHPVQESASVGLSPPNIELSDGQCRERDIKGHRRIAQHLSHTQFRYNRVSSEEHPSELQSLMRTSYAVSCLQKKTST